MGPSTFAASVGGDLPPLSNSFDRGRQIPVSSLILIVLGSALGGAMGALAVERRSWRWMSAFVVVGALVIAGVAELPGPHATEQRLRIISVLDTETTTALVESFSRETGIQCEVDPFVGGTQSTVRLLLQGRLQPDVFLGGTVEIHEELSRADKLARCEIPEDARRVSRYDDPDQNWVPLYLGYLALVHRPTPELRSHPPDWLTLIQPRWKGRVTIPSPAQSGGGLVFLATQLQRQSDAEKGWEYMKLLVDGGAQFEARSDIPITNVAKGTFDLGVAWAHDILRRIDRERIPVEMSIPGATGYEVGGASILADARNLEAAQTFVRFLTGPRAAEIQVSNGYRVPLRTDVDPPAYLQGTDLGDDATDFYDRAQVLAKRGDWVSRWETIEPRLP